MITSTLTRADYLKSDDIKVISTDTTMSTRWGTTDAADLAIASPLTVAADAQGVSDGMLAFLKLARADDAVIVEGVWPDLEGETIAVAYDGRMGVSGLVTMLVTRAKPNLDTGTTELQGEVLL